MVYEIIIDVIQVLNLVALTQVNFQKEIGNIDLQKIYQPINNNVVYGNKLKVLRVEPLLTMDEAKTYCKNAKSDVFFVNTKAPILDEIFNKFQFQSWAHIPAGPLGDACPRSFISSLRSAFPRAFSKLFFRVPRFAFPRSKFCFAFLFRALQLKNILRS